ncbi:DUF899 domain-containing protein [Pseudonocardia ailaonensis]|uniref:DUF899 domain-containing protein n=1 Tax=Pseudonocardia ailaonensis TaxID=367279 RepID=A0ABN2N1V4_9PSEU
MIVTSQEWEAARLELLVKEKELTRAADAVAAARRRMPWQEVSPEYVFEGPSGQVTLDELFAGRSQLVVYRAFYEPGVFGWPERPCRGCSMIADHIGDLAHVNARDTTFVFASRAPYADIAGMKERMGWRMPWYSFSGTFDRDHGVDEWHGTNVFTRSSGRIHRTYFLNNRGDESLGSTWSILDLTPRGRQEEWEDSPEGVPQSPPYEWWNWHDSYGADPRTGWSEQVERGIEAFEGTRGCCSG